MLVLVEKQRGCCKARKAGIGQVEARTDEMDCVWRKAKDKRSCLERIRWLTQLNGLFNSCFLVIEEYIMYKIESSRRGSGEAYRRSPTAE
jgi:hypothetical protein